MNLSQSKQQHHRSQTHKNKQSQTNIIISHYTTHPNQAQPLRFKLVHIHRLLCIIRPLTTPNTSNIIIIIPRHTKRD